MNIAVFCSSIEHLDNRYSEAATELGHWMGKEGHTLVFGGADCGLMRRTYDAVKEAGGSCIGVIPEDFERRGRDIPGMDVKISTSDLSERKNIMLDHSDVAVILPGGLGTLDELFTTMSDLKLGYHKTRVILYNVNGFWDSFIAMIEDLRKKQVFHCPVESLLTIVSSQEELSRAVKELSSRE